MTKSIDVPAHDGYSEWTVAMKCLIFTTPMSVPPDPCQFKFEIGKVYDAEEWGHAPGHYMVIHSDKTCPFHNTKNRFKVMDKKFLIHYEKEATTIREVLCEEVFAHSWELKPGEKKYKILSKLFLDKDGQFPIWYSWALYDSEALALNAAAGALRQGMERLERKGGPKFDERELVRGVAAIVSKSLER